jgi:hypothetical protein
VEEEVELIGRKVEESFEQIDREKRVALLETNGLLEEDCLTYLALGIQLIQPLG